MLATKATLSTAVVWGLSLLLACSHTHTDVCAFQPAAAVVGGLSTMQKKMRQTSAGVMPVIAIQSRSHRLVLLQAAENNADKMELAEIAANKTTTEEDATVINETADELLASLERGGDLIKNTGGNLIKSLSQNELLGAVLDASGQIAKDLFVIFRRTAANALTASLPEDEREELLLRTLGQEKVEAARKLAQQYKDDDDSEDDDSPPTMSVKENMAAAAVRKLQKDPAQWEQEKAQIYQQAEQAAKERVETELAIQQQRMDQEKRKYLDNAKAALEDLSRQKAALEALQADIQREKNAMTATAVQAQTERLQAMEEALKEKEEQAQQDQQKIERLAQELEAAAAVAKKDAAAKPRIHAGRYTPEEYRNLTGEEKEQVKALREKEGTKEENEASSSSSTDQRESDIHPVLGPVIEDLGYKRIHLLSAGKLGTIPIWKKQRIYRHERAKSMVHDKWKSMNLGLPGIICLHEDKDGKLAIVDGQHRVGMMMLLRDKQRKAQLEHDNDNGDYDSTADIDFDRVLVEVYPYQEANGDDDKHAQDLFLEINKSEPIKLVDMPGVAKSKDRKIITEAVDQLYDLYPNMFSPSQRCRIPNVNVDNMRNNLFGANVMTTHKLTTSKKLLGWMLEQNELLAKKYEGDEEIQSAVSPKAWKKANTNGFYLGLESSWLYN